MSDHHDHSRKLNLGIALNLAITLIEYIVGVFSGSLALISDASHNLTDVVSLVIAAIANKVAQRKSDDQKTYGYGRATILAALINTLFLYVLAVYIFYESYQRIVVPSSVHAEFVIVIATISIIINSISAFIFSKDKKDLNIKSVYLHQIYDTLSAIGALIAGLLVLITGKTIFDPILSIVIGIMMIAGVWGTTKKAVNILLEGIPDGVSTDEIRQALFQVSLVKTVRDLHVWSVSSHFVALSCHIQIDQNEKDKVAEVLDGVKMVLKDKFNITHSTIEVETIDCEQSAC